VGGIRDGPAARRVTGATVVTSEAGVDAGGGAQPQAILLLRTSALGDVVHSLPVASALRRAYPAARLGWVVEEPFAALVASHPAVDVVLPVALRRWRRAPLDRATQREAAAFLGRLRTFCADVALDLMGNHKAGILARLSGASLRLGARRDARREPSSAAWLNRRVELAGLHAVDRALSLLRGLGLDPGPADFAGAALLPADPAAVGNGPDEAPGYVLLQPGAGWASKRYPPAWLGQVASGLAATGERVRVLAGPGEEALAEAVVVASAGGAVAVAPSGLGGLAAWLRGARLVIGGDTGPLHLAHALGAPVLALHGPTDPARHGPYGAPERALYQRLPCSFCYRRFAETKACLLELTPRRVLAAALDLLASR
jgi:heptosyltransferase I